MEITTIAPNHKAGRYVFYALYVYKAVARKSDGVLIWKKTQRIETVRVRSGISLKFQAECAAVAANQGLEFKLNIRENSLV